MPKQKVGFETAVAENPDRPERLSPEWHDYVMGQFLPDELQDGRPTCDGLRRVTELLVGEIVSNCIKIPQSPGPENGYLAVALASVTVKREDNSEIVWEDVAEVSTRNCPSEFAKHAAATAATRAQGRCYKKLLGLRHTMSAEEALKADDQLEAKPGQITPMQVTMIQNICGRLKVDVEKFISSGSTKYNHILEVTEEKAALMIEHLNNCKTGTAKLPETL